MFKNMLGVKSFNVAITLQGNLENSCISHNLNFQCDNKINTCVLHAYVYICILNCDATLGPKNSFYSFHRGFIFRTN